MFIEIDKHISKNFGPKKTNHFFCFFRIAIFLFSYLKNVLFTKEKKPLKVGNRNTI